MKNEGQHRYWFGQVREKKIRLDHWPEGNFIIPEKLIDADKGLFLAKIGGMSQMSFFISEGFDLDPRGHKWNLVTE